jgi:hypothetical protein
VSLAAIVEGGTLLKVVLFSLAAGGGIAVIFGAGVAGAANAAEALRRGRGASAAFWGTLTALCVVVAAGSVVLGIVAMAAKR